MTSSGNHPVVKIDVDDAEFKRFEESFDKFRKHIKEVPKQWKAVDDAVAKVKNPYAKMATILAGVRAQMQQATTAQEKFKIAAEGSGRALKIVYGYAKSTATFMGDAVKSLLKFASYAALFSAGGLFGLDRLAISASESRRSAQGLGVTPGEHNAAKVNFEKLVDVDATLQRIQEARTDLTKRYTLNAVGLSDEDIDKKDNAELLRELIPLLKKKYESTGGTLQAAEANGLTQFADISTLTRLHAVREDEIRQSQEAYDRDKVALGVADKTQAAWQAFAQQLDRSGYKIQNALIDGLSGLTGPLSDLSEAIANAIRAFLTSDTFKKWVNEAGTALQRFTKYLGSDEFQHDLKRVQGALDEFGGALIGIARVLGKVFNFGNEKWLSSSQYEKIDRLEKLDSKMASRVEHVLKNPSMLGPNASANDKWYLRNLRQQINEIGGANAAEESDLVKQLLGIENQRQRSGVVTQAGANTSQSIEDAIAAGVNAGRIKSAMSSAPGKQSVASDKWWGLEHQYGLPSNLLESVEQQESAGRSDATSPVGAKGAFQFMDKTWAQYGKGGDVRNEAQSADAAARLYSDLLKKYDNDVQKALAAYNWGEGNLDKYGLDKAPKETRDYITKIIADMDRRNSGADTATSPSKVATASTTPSSTLPPAQVGVTIYNNTGSDVHTVVNGLAAAQ